MSETTQTTRAFAPTAVAAVAATLGAAAAATVIWVVATMAGADLTVRFGSAPPMKITEVNVVVATLVGSLAGWGLLALLRRFTVNAREVWTVAAIVAWLVSLSGPLSATASAGTKATLVAMHLAVATVLIAVVRRTTSRHHA